MQNREVHELTILQIYQRAIREWQAALDPYEWTLAMHIIDRTLGWQKTRITVSTRRFLDGDTVYTGIKMGRTKMFKSLRSLEDKGLIVRNDDPHGREIKVYEVNLGWKPDMLPTPKHLKHPSATRTTPSVSRTTQSATRTREKEDGEKEESEKKDYTGAPEPSAPDTGDNQNRNPKESIRAAGQTFRAARNRHANQPNGTSVQATVRHAEVLWRHAVAEHHPTSMAQRWTQREVGMMKAKAKGWIHVRQIGFVDFVEWCAINWAQIMGKEFAWMTKKAPPPIPDLGFLISFMSQFADCWADDSFKDWLNSKERTEHEKLMARGMTAEEAAAEIGKRRAIEKMRDENRKERERVAVERRALDRQEKRVARMEHLPAHPQSKEATEARRRKLLGDDFKALDPTKKTEDIDWANLPTLDPNWEAPVERKKYL